MPPVPQEHTLLGCEGARAWSVRATRAALVALGCSLPQLATPPLAAVPPEVETWHLCELVGPRAQRPGVYGTDLGFTFVHPYRDGDGAVDERLVFLFGDTWPTPDSPCTEPPWRNDDVAATVRLAELPSYPPGPPAAAPAGSAGVRCPVLDFGAPDPLAAKPLRLLHEDGDLDLGYGRTPLTGWSDGRLPHAIFSAGEIATCETDADCGGGLECLRGELGRCAVAPCAAGEDCPRDPGLDDVLSPVVCRLDRAADCAAPWSPRRRCRAVEPEPERGVCADPTGSLWRTALAAAGGDAREADRRLLAARWVYVAAEDPARPGVHETVARFATAKFVNVAARTVAAFDPDDPGRSDYRPGHHTLLLWGRPWFLGAQGAESLLYLLYNELEPSTADGSMRWAPRYFAGYDAGGRPRWSASEWDAVPLYEGEFDLVNQLSVSWVEPLGAWVMLYGGNLPDAMKGGPGPRFHEAPEPGAVHLRWAAHPWGAARRDDPAGAWSDPVPVLRPRDVPQILACEAPNTPHGCAAGEPIRPLDFFRARLGAGDCRAGSGAHDRGNLYSANVIDVLTRAVPARRPGGRAAELIWNVSTWNPYAVQLIKTRIELLE